MTRTWKAALSVATLALLAACGGDDDEPAGTSTGGTGTAYSMVQTQDFKVDASGWTGESSDYTTDTAPANVVFELRDISSLGAAYKDSKAYYVSGTNRSDDLLLYVKKQFTGLVANTEYTFAVTSMNFLSNAHSGCMGVGGAPGESVWVIAAASATEPKAVTTNGDTRLNIDHGNQAAPGAASMMLGNIANGLPCDGSATYASKLVRNTTGIRVKTDAEGKVWVLLGIDSGFEATTSVYLQNVTMTFVPYVAPTTTT
ncbi:hypothetical protein [Pseudoduganella umbonata]|uniref:Lipoprotein n=1 Tax=Pseudoduganella umbonata TaxID=864828 RepID=A0A4P8HND9_9BURK|nr:hypothetical protein [Pseudoduganella umbonata]MBB3224419.1 hypothetical protein [Pseudoduganella umbonata]QCP11223.1 hypothetical protein FCL38_12950 [Pseudoduganella umbonata]